MNPGQRIHFSLTSFRFFRPAQNSVAHTRPKETFALDLVTNFEIIAIFEIGIFYMSASHRSILKPEKLVRYVKDLSI